MWSHNYHKQNEVHFCHKNAITSIQDLIILYTKRLAQLFWSGCVYQCPLLVVSGSWQLAINCQGMLPEMIFYLSWTHVGGTHFTFKVWGRGSPISSQDSLYFSLKHLRTHFHGVWVWGALRSILVEEHSLPFMWWWWWRWCGWCGGVVGMWGCDGGWGALSYNIISILVLYTNLGGEVFWGN